MERGIDINTHICVYNLYASVFTNQDDENDKYALSPPTLGIISEIVNLR